MIPFIIAAIPIEVEPYPQVHDWTDINRAAQISTKETFLGGGVSMGVKAHNGMVQNLAEI